MSDPILSAAGIALSLLSSVVAAVFGDLSAFSSQKSRWIELVTAEPEPLIHYERR